MSLINILTQKTADSALSSSRALSRFTNTTYAEAGTSLDKIVQSVNSSAVNAVNSTGISDSTVYSPITAMRDYAISLDPNGTDAYNTSANLSLSHVDDYANSNLSGLTNSLFDIQRVGREGISSGVDKFSGNMFSINPAIANDVTNIGLTSLSTSGRNIDTVCSSAFSAATNQVSSFVSSINNTIADKASTVLTSREALSNSVTQLPTTGSEISTVVVTGSRVKVGYTSYSQIEDPASATENSTDVIYQEVKVYIEGVQVPFESASISQAMGQLPRASIQVPPQAGLMDIIRYYEPKIHIFYNDRNTGGDRLLFWGHIVACNYGYSKQNNYATISFECEHKNALMEQITFEWSAGGTGHATEGDNLTDQNPDQATIQLYNFNSELTMILALQGITGLQTDNADVISPDNADVIKADPTKLDLRFKEFENRFIGMPSTIMNLWNQVKKEIFANKKLNTIFTKMYLPLVEDGIAFFDRMSGHHFLEKQIDSSRQKHCNDHARPEASKYDTLLPPSYRMDITSAAHTQLMLNALNSQLGFSNEQMNFYQLFSNFFYTMEYDMLTLASPSEIPVDPTNNSDLDDAKTWRSQSRMAVETIVKPQLPFYYSPICNVILPNMFHTIQVSQAENTVPTRITVMNTALSAASNSPTSIGVNYRAPQSIREAVAIGKKILGGQGDSTLQDTTASSYNVPGRYELGRGIRHKKLMMPVWLSYFSSGSNEKRSANDDEVFPTDGSVEAKNLSDLRLAWIDRYGYNSNDERETSNDALNPYTRKSKVMAYERMLFAAADYDYTKEVVKSKTGSVEAIFNPYIIPGYPMDIIDRSPNNPSFHALCSSVTHSISPNSLATSIGFVAAITYTELSNYFLAPTHPWLQTALKLVNVERGETLIDGSTLGDEDTSSQGPIDKISKDQVNATTDSDKKLFASEIKSNVQNLADNISSRYGLSPDAKYDSNKGDVNSASQTLLQNPRAKIVADQFYKSTLGVGAAYPELMYDFETGEALAVSRVNGGWIQGSNSKLSLPTGGEGNDNYTGVGNLRLVRRQVESRKSIEDKFDLKFIDMTPNNYNGAQAAYTNEILTNSTLLEPGASPFLDYPQITDFINN